MVDMKGVEGVFGLMEISEHPQGGIQPVTGLIE